MQTSPILAFDFLDPWGWVAERRLNIAMTQAGITRDVTFHPCRSSLSQSATAMSYRDFLGLRFGTQAEIHQFLVAAELRKLGIEPAFGEIAILPDTCPALAAVLWLQRRGRSAQHFVGSVFAALYCRGQDIGDPVVLEKLLCREMLAFGDIQEFMRSDAFGDELRDTEASVATWAGRVIPSLRIDGTVVFGAQTPSVLIAMLR
ncbi:DsbA family protein [Pseudomonas plecoglossicida]|uniref:DsbA family protein n=1 Tax=Pseudomonas plecoglossicida TaxID=70775 RepID=UPI003977DD5E